MCSPVGIAQTSTRYVDGLRDKAQGYLVLTNVTVVPQPGELLREAMVVIRGSKIEAVGRNLP
ncbi:MAG: hypothetical protein ACKOAX_10235, partial [Candidatus Kapaibacterium sp.]